jgi:hypothetical protein
MSLNDRATESASAMTGIQPHTAGFREFGMIRAGTRAGCSANK